MVFLLIMTVWNEQKNQAIVDLIKSDFLEVSNSYSCQDFYRHILIDNALLSQSCTAKGKAIGQAKQAIAWGPAF